MSILLANAIQLMDVVMSGILPRNPRLRLVSVESGIGWMPFVKEALDHGFEYTNVRAEKPEFTRRPSEYLREQVWACTFFEEFAAHNFLDAIGTDRVLFETDYPHPICLYGSEVRAKIDAAFGELAAGDPQPGALRQRRRALRRRGLPTALGGMSRSPANAGDAVPVLLSRRSARRRSRARRR